MDESHKEQMQDHCPRNCEMSRNAMFVCRGPYQDSYGCVWSFELALLAGSNGSKGRHICLPLTHLLHLSCLQLQSHDHSNLNTTVLDNICTQKTLSILGSSIGQ